MKLSNERFPFGEHRVVDSRAIVPAFVEKLLELEADERGEGKDLASTLE